jgi:hypothetical protein
VAEFHQRMPCPEYIGGELGSYRFCYSPEPGGRTIRRNYRRGHIQVLDMATVLTFNPQGPTDEKG